MKVVLVGPAYLRLEPSLVIIGHYELTQIIIGQVEISLNHVKLA
jgi:hypothetical protein